MREGGQRLARIRDRLLNESKSGVKTIALDQLAEKLILEADGEPSFKTVKGYYWSTCICVNDCIVHGIPDNYVIQKGDLITIDVGMFYKGYHTDTASTIIVGEGDDLFLKTGKEALKEAISQAQAGNRIGQISQKMQVIVESTGYNVSRTLVGHGVGKQLHEEPQIPCFLEGKIEETGKLTEGMTIAVEIIYMEGNWQVKFDKRNKWAIYTKDGSRSAMFEHSIAIEQGAPLVLTE